ncbi:MAG: hypothetical protein ACREQZ_12595 [Woeseiaceae bacterium]
MSPHLTYRPREGVVFGVVAGKSIRLATLRTQAGMNIDSWEKVQELRPGAAPAGAIGHRLTVAENAALEIYDYPGEYAQRFDGVSPGGTAGGSANHRHHGRVVWVKLTIKTRFPGGGFYLHGPAPCGNPRCIVIAQDWDSLFRALKATRQVSIVVEL